MHNNLNGLVLRHRQSIYHLGFYRVEAYSLRGASLEASPTLNLGSQTPVYILGGYTLGSTLWRARFWGSNLWAADLYFATQALRGLHSEREVWSFEHPISGLVMHSLGVYTLEG